MARAHVDEPEQVRLSDGSLARVVPSRFAGGWELEVDGTPSRTSTSTIRRICTSSTSRAWVP
jgi:hypothetical protein